MQVKLFNLHKNGSISVNLAREEQLGVIAHHRVFKNLDEYL